VLRLPGPHRRQRRLQPSAWRVSPAIKPAAKRAAIKRAAIKRATIKRATIKRATIKRAD